MSRLPAEATRSIPTVANGTNAYELAMLVEAGLTPMEAIVAATSGAAAGIDMPDVGTVAPGMLADLVLVNGDPLADIRCLQEMNQIAMVIKDGRIVVDRSV
jgi:imidazolonepropionase-like amidohydrolase